jgi:TonB family protein
MVETVRQYAAPVLLALLLHALVVAALRVGWQPTGKTIREIKPQVVMAQLIVMDPKPAPRAAPKPTPKPMVKTPPKTTPETKKPAPAKAQPKPEPAQPRPDPAEQQKREAERKQAQEAARQQALEAAREARLAELASLPDEQLQADSAQLSEESQSAAAQATLSFQQGIYKKVVDNWSRPPSARNGMEAELLVELVPTGDVVGVTLLRSSGNASFDQSAESAVRKARRFEVPKESMLFERHFRRFNLLFRPEDLLR